MAKASRLAESIAANVGLDLSDHMNSKNRFPGRIKKFARVMNDNNLFNLLSNNHHIHLNKDKQSAQINWISTLMTIATNWTFVLDFGTPSFVPPLGVG